MTDDIVKYLRLSRTRFNRHAEAADEIEHLRADFKRLEQLLFQEIYYGQEKSDEIERLRELADNLAQHLQGYVCHCNMSKCKCGYDDLMDEYKAVRGD